ncbi:PH domain-containing protein [Halobacillus karajensis]|uniref:Bacterial membrane flanked domain protein n=1 Tax=Halobacillus karajensis TaxID=195088 RepID=A0A024P7C2_9BACI|nr:PH domain-containing protein [Halobacillus karajensis]CDQ20300.1 Bacterial membrane flanked domain protein [Halobacillus karajensis]CDQ25039.1 Bacterial membrane flanked domain protein [Halobacillus karajensis]CDQ28600.1 Bacterial membrane flanked domain protein [Halobacillus karajensis]
MQTIISSPTKQLSKDSVKVWVISETLINVTGFILLGVLFFLDSHYSWYGWVTWLLIALTILSVSGTVWSFFKAVLLYKHWRYDVNEEFLQLKSGALHEEHQLIPMTKIQSVSTHQGPLLRKYQLYSIKIHTMGSIHVIPALPEAVAFELRNQIATYAKVEEE